MKSFYQVDKVGRSDLEVNEGEIVLRAKMLGDQGQNWFRTKGWQEGEREADEDISAGRLVSFDSVDDAIAFLHKRAGRRYRGTSKS